MRSLSLSLFAISFVVLGCGVSPSEPTKTDTAATTTTSSTTTSTSTTATPDGGATVTSDAQGADTLAVSIDSEPTIPVDGGTVDPSCVFEGQFAKNVPSACSPEQGVTGGRYVCRILTGVLQPNCELATVVVPTPDAMPAVTPDASVTTDTAPVNSPYCKFAGEYPAALQGACSPSVGQKNGSFVCRALNGSLQPNCEPTPPPVTPVPDAGTQADTMPATTSDTQVSADTTPVVKTDASAMDTTPVVLIDSGTTVDTQVPDTTPASTDSVPDTLVPTDTITTTDTDPNACVVGTADIACTITGCDGFAVRHCNGGKLMACTCVHANFPGPAILDCQKDTLGNYTFTLWGVPGQTGIGGNYGLEGGFFYSERGTPANVCLAGSHNNWAVADCKTDVWGPYQTYQIVKATNMVGAVVNVVGSAPGGLRWGDFDPYDSNHAHIAYNVGTIMPAGICNLTSGGVTITQ